jgi:hypothetical protein
MGKNTITFDGPKGETKETDWIMRILQNIGGSWAHLIDVAVVNSGDLSVELTQEDLDQMLKEMLNTIYKCEKLQLGAENAGVIFFPEHGPIRIEIIKRPVIEKRA